MGDWMSALAVHYWQTRLENPGDLLLVVTDVDGTLLDERHRILHLLTDYDHTHGTDWFRSLEVGELVPGEEDLEGLLEARCPRPGTRTAVRRWFSRRATSRPALDAAHAPFRGALEVLRWFQDQPGTFVALNTGRPVSRRAETLRSLNELGYEHDVQFDPELMVMNAEDAPEAVPACKAWGLATFRARGFRIVAVIDNEPENLAAMEGTEPTGEVLFLHASSAFRSAPRPLARTVQGSRWDAAALAAVPPCGSGPLLPPPSPVLR